MADPRLQPGLRIRIDHASPLVALDLCEIVELAGASVVLIGQRETDLEGERFDAWITDAGIREMSDPDFATRAFSIADAVILVWSGLDAASALPPGMHLLAEPFRTEDVFRALDAAGLFAPDAEL